MQELDYSGTDSQTAWIIRRLEKANARIKKLEELVAAYADPAALSDAITELRRELGI